MRNISKAVALVLTIGTCQVASADACERPALGFISGSDVHLSRALDTESIGSDRISLQPEAAPPDDAIIAFENHPEWGHTAIAAIVTASGRAPEYLPNLSRVSALTDYFVIYIDQDAPAGSEFADYLFHSKQGLSAGYHLVHAEENLGSDDEPVIYTVVDIDQPIPNNFERGAVPTGMNL